jgi:hypothetical protein
MIMTEFEYHIYAKGEVLFHCLSEQDFQVRWHMLNSMVGPNSAVTKKDLSFTRVLAHDGGVTSDPLNEPSY